MEGKRVEEIRLDCDAGSWKTSADIMRAPKLGESLRVASSWDEGPGLYSSSQSVTDFCCFAREVF